MISSYYCIGKIYASLTIINKEKNINNNNLFLILCVLNSSHCFFFWWEAIIIKIIKMKRFWIFHIIPKETDNLLPSLMVFVHSGYGLWNELKLKIDNIYLSISDVIRSFACPWVSFHFIVNGFFDTLWIRWDKLRMRCKW